MDCKTIKKSKKKNLEMINEFSRSIKEKYSNGTNSGFSFSGDIYRCPLCC